MDVQQEVKDAILAALAEAGDHYVFFSDLVRRARQINPSVSYSTSTNLKALRELSEENLIVTWGGPSGCGKISSIGSMCRQRGRGACSYNKIRGDK